MNSANTDIGAKNSADTTLNLVSTIFNNKEFGNSIFNNQAPFYHCDRQEMISIQGRLESEAKYFIPKQRRASKEKILYI
jgi:hypothetical protein